MNRRCRISGWVLAGLLCLLAVPAASAADIPYAEAAARARECGVLSETLGLVASGVEEGGLARDEGAALLMPLIEACANRFPLAPFEDKLAEGLAKHVPAPRIIKVLEDRLAAYRFVRDLLAPRFRDVDPELLVTMAEGVSQGTPRDDLKRYVAEFSSESPEPFLTGAHMVCLLGQSSFDYALTRDMLEAAFAEGGPLPQWRYFIRIVLVGRQRGLADADMAAAARRVLETGGTLNDVSSRLGFTSRSLSGRVDSN
ncbi:MAG: hypothetical protein H0S80_11305 [Desulfovibrionaceae bacterium]|nr:hypothetical protein [Desulfovibrionaceae bacterium]